MMSTRTLALVGALACSLPLTAFAQDASPERSERPRADSNRPRRTSAGTITIEVTERRAGREMRRAFELALTDEWASSLETSDGDSRYEIVVRARDRRDGKASIELSVERTRRDDDRAKLHVTRRIERGKRTVMSRLDQADGQLVVEATLR